MRRSLAMILVLASTLLFGGGAWADSVSVRGASHGSYGRIVFDWPEPVLFEAAFQGDRLVVSFGRPIEASYGGLLRALGGYLEDARPGDGGYSVSFGLKGAFGLRSFDSGNRVVVDLMGAPGEGADEAEAEEEPADAGPRVNVRYGVHSSFTRVVFDWPRAPSYKVERDGGTLTLRFGEPAKANLSRIRRGSPRYIEAAESKAGADGLEVALTIPETSEVKHFLSGPNVVVDVMEPSPDAPKPEKKAEKPAPEPEPEAKPAPEPEATPAPKAEAKPETEKKAEEPAPAKPEETPPSAEQPPAPEAEAAKPAEEPKPEVQPKPEQAKPEEPKPAQPASEEPKLEQAAPEQAKPAAPEQPKAEQPPTPDEKKPAPKPEEPAPKPSAEDKGAAATPTKLVPPEQEAKAESQGGEAEETVLLRFDWSEPVAAAVFRRGGALWVVFDRFSVIDPVDIMEAAGSTVADVEKLPIPDKTVLRMITAPEINPIVKRDGLSWILEMGRHDLTAGTPVEVKSQPDSPIGARLFVPVPEPGSPIPVLDPGVGDNIVVVPVIPLGHGIASKWRFPQIDIPVTGQGLVFKPLIDDVRIRPLRQGVEVTTGSEFHLTPVSAEIEAESKVRGAMTALSRILDLSKWTRTGLPDFVQHKHRLHLRVAAATGKKKEKARVDLAEFYFAMGFGVEAKAILNTAVRARRGVRDDPKFRFIRGGANWLMGRWDEAEKDLFHKSLDNKDEAAFWRGATMAMKGDMEGGAPFIRRTIGIIRPYPKPLKFPLGLLAAEASLTVGDLEQANSQLEVLSLAELSARQTPQVTYLDGRVREMAGDFDTALQKWEEAMDGPDHFSRARAAQARTELLLSLDRMSIPEAIEEYEKLRFTWRGDEFEFRMLRRLGALYMESNKFRAGLKTLRQAATYFRNHKEAPEVTQEMAEVFAKLYLEDAADVLKPVTAIALYEEFRELTPAGDKGDRLIRKLAERLVGVDLLDKAAEILDNQVTYRLTGVERVQVALRLAQIHLLNKDPAQTIEVLDNSELRGAPSELALSRKLLRARALADMKRHEEALELIKKDEDEESERLRAEFFWELRNWAETAQALRRVLKLTKAKPNTLLSDIQAKDTLSLAVALTLSNNERAVARLRRDYGAGMARSPLADPFSLIGTPEVRSFGVDVEDINDKVKKVENFQAFLQTYKERLREREFNSVN